MRHSCSCCTGGIAAPWLVLLFCFICIHVENQCGCISIFIILPWQNIRLVLECELSALAQMLATRFLEQHDEGPCGNVEGSESLLTTFHQGPYERKVTSRVFLLDKKKGIRLGTDRSCLSTCTLLSGLSAGNHSHLPFVAVWLEIGGERFSHSKDVFV